jgi:multidrug efflux pump
VNAIIDAAISHSRTVLLSLVLILLAGGVAYQTIPKEDSPDVNIPMLYVSMVHEGISPEDAERLLIKPMEKELRALEGVKEMTSTAYLGGANVVMEFDAGFDADKALADVREKVDLATPELPEDAEEPTVHEINLSLFPVLTVSLAGSAPERTLLRIARDLQDRIESISSVLEAEIVGDRDELLEVIIDPLALESYNLNASDILEMVAKSNMVVAAGALDTGQGRFAVKVPGLFETMEDIVNLPVKVNGDAVVRFRDVASLRRSFKDSDGFSRLNGKPSLALKVSKRTGENIIETIESVRAVVEAQRTGWPDTVTVAYSQDKSTDIRNNLLDLQNNILSAILLVMVVVVAALGLRSACFVGIAIPCSFLAGILVLAMGGLTVNMVVLFGLILVAGMLVDGAIIVTEYADRKMSEGLPKQEAYALAGKRMAWPIISSTATTLAAFLPLMFWPGVVGEFMKYLPLTLIATLTASLVVALIFVPTLGSVFGKPGGTANAATMKALAASEHGDLHELKGWTGRYVKVLGFALRYPGGVLVAAVLSLVAATGAYATYGRGVEFFPNVEPNNAVLQIHARGNLAVEERDALVRQVEAVVLDMQRERGEFHAITAESMASSGQRGGDEPEDVIGNITLEFTDWFLRRPASEIFAEIRERSAIFGGVVVEPREEEHGPPVGKPVQIQVSSSDPALIEPTALRIAEAMGQMGGFVDIEDGTQIPGIEWQLTVDRAQAAKFGADISLVGSYVRMITNGMKLGEYRPDDSSEEIDIVVRLPEQYRTIEQLDQIRIQTSAGLVPVANFVKREPKPRVGLLRRVDGNRAMTVKADVAPGLLVDDKVQQVRSWLAGQDLDPRITLEFKGEDEEQKAARDFLGKAFAVALFLMAIILVTQFNSFYSAFLILSAVIMSTVGVMIGLLVTDQPFGIIMSGIGVIALAGIVVNNNIVLIDTFDRLSETGTPGREAILRTGAQRLRPVMLTTVTTILGLMPMVLATNIDFFSRTVTVGAPSTQWWRQLSTAVAFGLTFATLLTLVVTPSALMLRENLRAYRAARRATAVPAPADAEAGRRGKPSRPVSEAAE